MNFLFPWLICFLFCFVLFSLFSGDYQNSSFRLEMNELQRFSVELSGKRWGPMFLPAEFLVAREMTFGLWPLSLPSWEIWGLWALDLTRVTQDCYLLPAPAMWTEQSLLLRISLWAGSNCYVIFMAVWLHLSTDSSGLLKSSI